MIALRYVNIPATPVTFICDECKREVTAVTFYSIAGGPVSRRWDMECGNNLIDRREARLI